MTLLYLLVGVDSVSDRHWTYFADRDVIVNRVAEFKHFAGDPPRGKTVICCEITDSDQFSIERVIDELTGADFLPAGAPILDTKIIRLERAYPIYDRSYDEQIEGRGRRLPRTRASSTLAGTHSSFTRTWTRSSKKPRRSSR